MDNVKNILLSKTIQGILLMVTGKFLNIDLDNASYEAIINNSLEAISAIGAIWAVYGRYTATKKLTFMLK